MESILGFNSLRTGKGFSSLMYPLIDLGMSRFQFPTNGKGLFKEIPMPRVELHGSVSIPYERERAFQGGSNSL